MSVGKTGVGRYSWRDDPNFNLRGNIQQQSNQNRDILIRNQQDRQQLAESLARMQMQQGQIVGTGRFDLARRLLGL